LELVVALNFPFGSGSDASFTHDSGNAVFTALYAVVNKILVDLRCSVYAMAGCMKKHVSCFQGTGFHGCGGFHGRLHQA
jgi:hypothetical protein